MKIVIAILFLLIFIGFQSEIQDLQQNIYELSIEINKLKKNNGSK